MTSLFLPRESLISDIPAGDGTIEKLFYGVGAACFVKLTLYLCCLQESGEGCWERLVKEVLAIFVEKHIFKSLSPDLPIYQVFCIRQLLK
jgi:hypothetical protein